MREYFESDGKYLKLDINISHEEMLAEAFDLIDEFTPHRSDDYSHNGWESLTIHGLGAYKHENFCAYGYKNGKEASNDYVWTEIADKCPATIKWLKEVFPCNKYGRVRFMLLRAGGKIDLHKDSSVKLIENINVALNNPEGCKWIWGDGEELIMEEGGTYAMNLYYEHSVVLDGWKTLMEDAAKRQDITGNYIVIDDLP